MISSFSDSILSQETINKVLSGNLSLSFYFFYSLESTLACMVLSDMIPLSLSVSSFSLKIFSRSRFLKTCLLCREGSEFGRVVSRREKALPAGYIFRGSEHDDKTMAAMVVEPICKIGDSRT